MKRTSRSGSFADHAPHDRVWTDEDGRFHVRGIPEDGIATLVVSAEGRRQARVAVKAFGDKEGETRELALVLR